MEFETQQKVLIEKIGECLRELRLTKGLSQMDVAAAAGIDKSAYQRIERGRTNPSIKMLNKVLVLGMEEDIITFFQQFNAEQN